MERAEAQRARAIERYAESKGLPWTEETEADIVRHFEDSALDMPWKKALVALGLYDGLTDEMGRPKNRETARSH